VLSTTVHEFGHAWMATKLGDPLPRAQGRLTLSPVRHVDPIGTLVMPFLMVFFHLPLIAWGKPVRTDPRAYTKSLSRSTGSMLVSISGPLMNLAMAAIVTVVLVVAGAQYLVFLNIVLMAINLIPIHPLDGGAVLEWLLPASLQGVSDFLRRWGNLILLGALFVPQVFQTVLGPVYGLAETARTFVVQVASR
jgi:Zn-dependent protease